MSCGGPGATSRETDSPRSRPRRSAYLEQYSGAAKRTGPIVPDDLRRMPMNYDFVVIGGGNAGLSAANRVAAAGKTVALMDKGPVGGLCSLAGCNPKKVLVRASEVLDEVRRAGEHGIDAPVRAVDW